MKTSARASKPFVVVVAVPTVASMGASSAEKGLGGMVMYAHRINHHGHLLLLLLCRLRHRRVVRGWVACMCFGGLAFGSARTTVSAVGEAG
jgi:hypothetical protein